MRDRKKHSFVTNAATIREVKRACFRPDFVEVARETRLRFALPVVVFALSAAVARAGDSQPPIVADQIKQTIEKLAGEDFLGREAGSEGGKAAGEWIASECEKLGLKPCGDDGTYFQNFKASGRKLRNVVATLPARENSETSDEVVVIGSHYDHLGKGGFGALDLHDRKRQGPLRRRRQRERLDGQPDARARARSPWGRRSGGSSSCGSTARSSASSARSTT